MSAVQVFVSFDVDHDAELYEQLVEQAESAGLTIRVSGHSEPYAATDAWGERTRRELSEADQVVVICGEHTEDSLGVFTELRIAQDEKKPYFLLWGLRDTMCTKPSSARPADGMYSWTLPILQEQFARMSRTTQRDAAARRMKRSKSTASAPVPADRAQER